MTTTAPCHGEDCRSGRTDGRAPRRPAPGSLLCHPCRDRLDAALAELAHLYRECGRMLGGRAPGSLRERTTGGELPGLPFNAAAADARTRMISVLGSWSGLVAQQRRLTSPPRTIDGLTAFLRRNTDWLAAHSAAAEATHEIARLVTAGQRAAFPDPARSIRLGTCPQPRCTGALTLELRTRERPANPEIACDADPGHRWTTDQWSALSHRMDQSAHPAGTAPAERWLTAADISRLWNTPPGTVYRLASQERWRRHTRAGRAYYSESDVRACFTRRAAPRPDTPAPAPAPEPPS
ncbi:hypothetical protein [Streptomyces sp. CAU 1734]|uniref:hypothetical protein n=1 Tax=Streptomyces sp. CAU 1734 TaxID=3140360 RepID=UPI0032611C37